MMIDRPLPLPHHHRQNFPKIGLRKVPLGSQSHSQEQEEEGKRNWEEGLCQKERQEEEAGEVGWEGEKSSGPVEEEGSQEEVDVKVRER
jgi:hypothetical protein